MQHTAGHEMSNPIDLQRVVDIIFTTAKAKRTNPAWLSKAEQTLVQAISSEYPVRGEQHAIDRWLSIQAHVRESTIRYRRSHLPRERLQRKGALGLHDMDLALQVIKDNPKESARTCRRILREDHNVGIKKEKFRLFRKGMTLKRTLK
jgi:hypothetical protein